MRISFSHVYLSSLSSLDGFGLSYIKAGETYKERKTRLWGQKLRQHLGRWMLSYSRNDFRIYRQDELILYPERFGGLYVKLSVANVRLFVVWCLHM